MKIQIVANQVDLSNHHRDYIEMQMSSLENQCSKLTDESVSVKVSVRSGSLKHTFVLSALLIIPGLDMRAESTDPKLEVAVKKLASKLSKQISKYKTKHAGRKRILIDAKLKKSEIKAPMLQEIYDVPEKSDKDLLKKITKRKVFSDLIPMSALEALKAVLELDHTFFVFVNNDTDRYNLMYVRRNNKGYGLVELESKSGVLNYKLSDFF